MPAREDVATFELALPGISGPDPAALGLWRAIPHAESEVSFATPQAPQTLPMPEWRARLPRDRKQATNQFMFAERTLQATRLALPEAHQRLARVARGQSDLAPVSYGIPGEPSPPESELGALLGEPPSLSAAHAETDAWAKLRAGFQAFLDRIVMSLAPHASVKTHVGDRMIGWTVVRWPAGMTTVRHARAAVDDDVLHQTSIRMALQARTTMLRTLVYVIRGAAVLATAVATPVGPLLALPAAWKLIDDVQREFTTAQGKQLFV